MTANWTLSERIGIRVECVRMGSKVHFLLHIGHDEESMLSACFSACLSRTVLFSLIVPHHEVVLEPICGVIVYVGVIHQLQVLIKAKVELAVFVLRPSLLITPWVSEQ